MVDGEPLSVQFVSPPAGLEIGDPVTGAAADRSPRAADELTGRAPLLGRPLCAGLVPPVLQSALAGRRCGRDALGW